jgi:hypothetical protein
MNAMSCWESFLKETAKRAKTTLTLNVLNKMRSRESLTTEQLAKLLDRYAKGLVVNKCSLEDIIDCLQFANDKVMLEDGIMKDCLLSIINSNLIDDKTFICFLLQIRKSISTQVLNGLNSKLIEKGKENIMFTVFNLAINNAFGKANNKEITLPRKYISQLVILQQRKMLSHYNP